MTNTIGLFGTCGRSTWRDNFIERFNKEGITFFNPVVEDWKPSDAIIEAEHLANDNIILFPVTSETYGTGSLAETGFSILNAIKMEERRDFVLLIDDFLDEDLMENQEYAKDSLRARALVLEHLRKMQLPNVYLVKTLDEMIEVAITIYRANEVKSEIQKFQLKPR